MNSTQINQTSFHDEKKFLLGIIIYLALNTTLILIGFIGIKP